MSHFTDEQLAELALASAAGLRPAGNVQQEHLTECADCRARLEAMAGLTSSLAAAHAQFDQSHQSSRERLLAAISCEPQPSRTANTPSLLATFLGGLNMRQRIALGGVGLSTAAMILLMIVFANPARELSAMERIVKAVREVTSYSFRWEGRVEFEPRQGKPAVIRETELGVYWRAPGPGNEEWFGDMAAPYKCFDLAPDPSSERTPKLRTDITERYPTGKPGILIDFVNKYYYRTPPLPADDIPKVSPIAMLRTVQRGSGKVLRDLGTRQIGGREARGYVLDMKEAPAFGEVEEVEVWIDPATDLPMEFSFVEGEKGEFSDVNRIVDCRWNIPLDDKLFDTTPPVGFTDATFPTDQAEIDRIVAALRLYAELNGGTYPELLKFDRDAVRQQMLDKAGFAGPPQADWSDDAKYQKIDEALPALQRLADVLHAKWHTGYYAEKVTANNRDKVLLWWPPARPHKGYLVFYGDLRPEYVPAARLVELEPATTNLVVYEDEDE